MEDDGMTPSGDSSDSIDGVVNPRLSDVFGLVIRQDEVDFVVPHLHEDLPLYLDPFLLWKSDRAEYRSLHAAILSFVDVIRIHVIEGRIIKARALLAEVSEPSELGLGYAAGNKRGSALGPSTISAITEMIAQMPQLETTGLDHIEMLALLVPGIAEDRISDLTASVIKGWLAQFTERRCEDYGIPTLKYRLTTWDADRREWSHVDANLPYNPTDGSPVLLVPLDMLRRLPWINYGDYYRSTYAPLVLPPGRATSAIAKKEVIAYNHAHFDIVRGYVAEREKNAAACGPDPIFVPLMLSTIKKKVVALAALPTGREGGADKKFEDLTFDLLSSLLYPELDLAAAQVRTASGAHIRDVIFHNDGKTPFLNDLRDLYGARQAVFELKNVAALETEHVNQLHRYLDNEDMGRFGILVVRTAARASVQRNIVDLHSSKRAAIICLDDSDLNLMVNLLDSGRRPIEALRKKYVEFTRRLPK
ncbi:hypothetical protein [Arthrobacter psychrochitiniphilus]|uniref:hypothetical protein n=1 Tax=Arthrobacter psychrochitiniphilus TaxID=291045 RepID=UPI003F7C360B